MRIRSMYLVYLLTSYFQQDYSLILKVGKGEVSNDYEGKGKIPKKEPNKAKAKELCTKLGKSKKEDKFTGISNYLIQIKFEGASGSAFTQQIIDVILEIISAVLSISVCSLVGGTATLTSTATVISANAAISTDTYNTLLSLKLEASTLLTKLGEKLQNIDPGLLNGVTIGAFTLASLPLIIGYPTPVPTTIPVESPTPVPVTIPVESPTRVPVTIPVESPTPVPVTIPVESPTRVPVTIPVESPTPVPVTIPVESPTPVPVTIPVEPPTPVPTNVPASVLGIPSVTPTVRPSASPQQSPTVAPSSPAAVPLTSIPMAPKHIIHDTNGNKYIADFDYYVIRKITPSGVATVLAGIEGSPGSDDGTVTEAKFAGPEACALDSAGNLFVADSMLGVIRKITPLGQVTTSAGANLEILTIDGDGTNARFASITGMAFDSSSDSLFVSDNTVIRKLTNSGTSVTTFAGGGSGYLDGTGGNAKFSLPKGLSVDTSGNIYVADVYKIRKITPEAVVTTVAGQTTSGFADGIGTSAKFDQAHGVAVDTNGNVFITDKSNFTIRKLVLATGDVSTIAGSLTKQNGYTDGSGSSALFDNSFGIDVDSNGDIYVADYGNSLIRKIDPTLTVTTYAGVYYVTP